MMAGCRLTLNLSQMLLYFILIGMPHSGKSLSPRIRLSHKELWQMNRTWVFLGHDLPLQPQTMLLEESHQTLYIGAKNALFSLSLDRVNINYRKINWSNTEHQIEECMMKGREKPECANYIKVLQKYNQTHLLVCGTGAFNPICAKIKIGQPGQAPLFALVEESVMSGKGRCPYNPNSPCTSTLSGGELYIGLYTDYWENDPALWRLNNHSHARTENNDRQQLNAPKFVGSAVIPDNNDRDDDKVYFFFTEREMDAEGVNRALYSRVGRVCANDLGGQRMLVNRWSSFLKTRLICSVAGQNGIDTHFDDLVDVFVLNTKDEKNPEIFGLFGTTSAVFKGFAVCVYQMEDIRAAFNGPFANRERPKHHWTPYKGRIPNPRPGSCASKMNSGGFSSSKEFPDEVLRFVRSHPVMYRPVHPQYNRPVLLQTEPGHRKLTQIAVDRVQAQDGHYHVLYIGTDDSMVLKVLTIYNKTKDTMEEVELEELEVFKVPAPIKEIIISPKRQLLYVGSKVGVAQVRLHQCDLYGTKCADCCLARDPYCAWDGLTCTTYHPAGVHTKRSHNAQMPDYKLIITATEKHESQVLHKSHRKRFRRQDVRHGNAVQLCNGLQIDDEQWQQPEERLIYGVENNSTLLECVPRSLQAKVLWFLRRGDEEHELRGDERVIMTSHGLLFLHVRSSDGGVYVCQTVEHGYVRTLLKISLHVLKGERVKSVIHMPSGGEEETAGAPCHTLKGSPPSTGVKPRALLPHSLSAPNSRLWYKEFLLLIGYGDAQKVEEYCERVWCSDKKRKKSKKNVSVGGEKSGKRKGEESSRRAPRHTFDT